MKAKKYNSVMLGACLLLLLAGLAALIIHTIGVTESKSMQHQIQIDQQLQSHHHDSTVTKLSPIFSNQTQTSKTNAKKPEKIPQIKIKVEPASTTVTSLKFISDILPFWLQNFSDVETNQDKTITRHTIHYPQWATNIPRVLTTNTQLLEAYQQYLDAKGGFRSGDVSIWPQSEGYIYIYHKPTIKVYPAIARQNCGFKYYSRDRTSFPFEYNAPTGLEFLNTKSEKTDVETLIWISTPDDHIMQHMIDSTSPKWMQTVGLLYNLINDENNKEWINDGNWKIGLAWNEMLGDTGKFIVSHLWNQLGIDFDKHVFDYSWQSQAITAKHVIYGCYVPPMAKDSWNIVKKLFLTNPQTNLPYSIYSNVNLESMKLANDPQFKQVSISQSGTANEVIPNMVDNKQDKKLKIMFLSREKAKNGRVCVNEPEVIDAINQYLNQQQLNDTFEVMMFNGTNIIQNDGYISYLKHFSDVVVLIGTHGGAFYNVMFLNPFLRQTTIEVQMEYKMPYPFLPALSSMVKNYAYMVKTVDQNEWRIDTQKIIYILQTQLALYL